MTSDPTYRNDPPTLPPAVAWRLWLARLAMAWERIWPALWPAIAMVAIFISLSLLGVWSLVHEAVQALIVFAVLIGTGLVIWQNLRRQRLPERREGLRRLEIESGLTHRPLSSFAEQAAAGSRDPRSQKLWRAHRDRLADQMRHVGIVLPRTDAPRHDPYALRLLIVLILGVCLLVAGTDWGGRLREAFAPLLGPGLPADVEVDAWIEPPAYTGLPPVTLVRGHRIGDGPLPAPSDRVVEVPEGATLVTRLSGFAGRPMLRLTPSGPVPARDRPKAIFSHDGTIVEGRAPIPMALSARLSVRGRDLGTWRFAIRADDPPAVMMPRSPEATNNASLRFFYRLADDYGVTKATAHIRVVPETAEEATRLADSPDADAEPGPWPHPARPLVLPLPVTPVAGAISDETAIENLADHPWAGRDVIVQIMAEDGAGQQAFSEGTRITLPQRIFLEPLAKSLVELRTLLADGNDGPYRVAAALDALTRDGDRFFEDTIVYFGLRTAYWRLTHEPRARQTREVYDLLWDLALRVEDGDLSESLQRLRQLQQALEDALQRGAPADEIRQLMAQLREALDRYLAELAQQSDRAALDPNAQTLSSDDLDSLLQSIEQLAELGAHGRARQMLAELQQLLEGLRPSAGRGGGGGGEPSPQEQALNDALSALTDIIAGQRGLLDETYRNTVPGGNSGGDLNEALREALRGAGENPEKSPRGGGGVNRPQNPGTEDLLRKLEELGRAGGMNPAKGPRGRAGAARSGDGQALADKQQALRQRLEDLIQGLGKAGVSQPDRLGEATGNMGAAGTALRGDRFGDAFRSQQDALDALRSGAESLAQDVLERQGRGTMAGRDPLGRNGQGLASGGVDLPDKSALQQAREILEELRRRAGERDRPQSELDYYDRLLRQF